MIGRLIGGLLGAAVIAYGSYLTLVPYLTQVP